jgi:hypothetical protein
MNSRQPYQNAPGLSRRQLVKTAAATGIAAWLSAGKFPAILHAQDKAGDAAPILGDGDHKFEWLGAWAQRPEDKPFGNTHSVQETADGRIFVHHTGPESVHVYDPDGKFIESWGKEYHGTAHGMDLRKEGNEEFLYLAPTGLHKVFKTDLKGNVVFVLDFPKDAKDSHTGKLCYEEKETTKKVKSKAATGEEEKEVKEMKPAAAFYVPTFTAFAPNGDFYVTDGYGAGYIHHYNIKGEYISTFGGKGDADDQTACPHGIYCDTRDPAKPILVVADREHHRLQYFTLDGKLDHLVVNDNAEETKNDAGRLRRPCHFNQRGSELVIPDLRGRVTILDKDNNAVAQLGDNPNASQRANNGVKQADTTPGHFCCPHGATWDSHGNIFVAEWLPYGRLTKLRRIV